MYWGHCSSVRSCSELINLTAVHLWSSRNYYYYYLNQHQQTGPSGKNNVVYKFLSQPHKHLRHRKLKKAQLREATNSWLHPWTHPELWCQTQCREDGINKIPQSNLSRQERLSYMCVCVIEMKAFDYLGNNNKDYNTSQLRSEIIVHQSQ